MDEANLTKGMEHLRPYVSIRSSTPVPLHLQPVQVDGSSLHNTESPCQSQIDHLLQPPADRRPHSPSNPHRRADPAKFGSRYLQEDDDIFEFNAWDSVPLTADFLQFAELQYEQQRTNPVSEFDRDRFNATPEKWWDRFYANNSANFFKDRKWLFKEFPSLQHATRKGADPLTILEVGCGAGNTAFPLLQGSENQHLTVYCCDFSKKAIEVVKESPLFDPVRMRADVWDVASPGTNHGSVGDQPSTNISLPPGLSRDSADLVILIFVFSALSPLQWNQALHNIYAVLKPGGEVLFRDYGRGDLAQVRFKKGRWMGENFYVRGDGTRVYFFEKEELVEIFGGAGENEARLGDAEDNEPQQTEQFTKRPKFDILDLKIDRRLLVNRQRRLKMYRCWMQGRFRKPIATADGKII